MIIRPGAQGNFAPPGFFECPFAQRCRNSKKRLSKGRRQAHALPALFLGRSGLPGAKAKPGAQKKEACRRRALSFRESGGCLEMFLKALRRTKRLWLCSPFKGKRGPEGKKQAALTLFCPVLKKGFPIPQNVFPRGNGHPAGAANAAPAGCPFV